MKLQTAEGSYTAVAWEYKEVIKQQMALDATGKVFFFGRNGELGEGKGRILKLEETERGLFILMEDLTEIRVDRIITLFGKLGAAYDEYDAYANACMDCNGGMENWED